VLSCALAASVFASPPEAAMVAAAERQADESEISAGMMRSLSGCCRWPCSPA
jgi:hypothetical protein